MSKTICIIVNMSTIHNTKLITLLLTITLLSGITLASTKASADTEVIDQVRLTVPIACTMTGEGTSHTATLDPGTYSGASGSEYENGIGKTTLTAICNDDNGFSIYAIGYTGNQYEGENHTKLVGQSTNSTISTKAYTSGDTASNWSMKLTKITDATVSYNPQNLTISTGYDNWHAVPDTFAKVAEYHANTGSSSTDTTLGVKLETTYAAYISSSQPADTYVGQVKYTMVHPYNADEPVIPRSLDAAATLQEVTYCSEDLPEGQVYTLTDSRDGNTYHAARLKDGRCWMLDNLALDLTDSTVQANLNSSTTNATDESISYLKGINTRNPEIDPNGQYATSAVAIGSTNTYSDPRIITSAKDNTYASDDVSEAKDWKFGIYYNYCAATAGSYCYGKGLNSAFVDVDATEDICPLGWRMPFGDGDHSEFKVLAVSMGLIAQEGSASSINYGEQSLQYRKALHLPLSGYVYEQTVSNGGDRGLWWSSSRANNTYTFYLRSDSALVYLSLSNPTYYGYSMRCIMK